jgi:hypothetical protein
MGVLRLPFKGTGWLASAAWLLAAVTLGIHGCTLNPQPTPPEEKPMASSGATDGAPTTPASTTGGIDVSDSTGGAQKDPDTMEDPDLGNFDGSTSGSTGAQGAGTTGTTGGGGATPSVPVEGAAGAAGAANEPDLDVAVIR